MADQPIVVRPGDAVILVSGRPMTDFPQAGVFISSEKFSPNSAHTEGLNGTTVTVRSNGKSRRVTMTLIQGSDDDVFMQNAAAALQQTNKVLSLSITYLGVEQISGNLDVETEPTRELAGDSLPNAVWTLTGAFPVFKMINLEAPEVLTEDEINAI